MDTENTNSIAPAEAPAANDNLTGPAPGGQSVKAPAWMKTRPTVPPNEEQKPPKLGERMKHLSSLFASHTNELQWTMHRNTKCMLELCEKFTESPRASPAPTKPTVTITTWTRKGRLKKNPLSILPVALNLHFHATI